MFKKVHTSVERVLHIEDSVLYPNGTVFLIVIGRSQEKRGVVR